MRNNLGIVLKRSRSSQSYSQTTLLVFPTVNVRKEKYKTRYRKCVTAARQARASSWRSWWCRNHGSGLVTWHIRGTRIRFEADIAPNQHRSNYFCSALETGANVDNIVPTNRRVMTPDDSPANSNNPFSSSFNPFPFFFSFQEKISQLVDLVVFWNVYGARFFTVNLSWH